MDTITASFISRSHELPALDVLGVEVRLLADANTTNGATSIALITCPAGGDAPPHRHEQSENFYVIEGSLSLLLENQWTELSVGEFGHVAPGVRHTFRNNGALPAKFLAIATPAGHDAFFRDADELARSGRFSPESAATLCEKHGIELMF